MKLNLSGLLLMLSILAGMPVTLLAQDEGVPLPCDPADCPPIDPCELAPERCRPGGPIEEPEPKPEPPLPDPEPEPEPEEPDPIA
jgi:hypothetical protein